MDGEYPDDFESEDYLDDFEEDVDEPEGARQASVAAAGAPPPPPPLRPLARLAARMRAGAVRAGIVQVPERADAGMLAVPAPRGRAVHAGTQAPDEAPAAAAAGGGAAAALAPGTRGLAQLQRAGLALAQLLGERAAAAAATAAVPAAVPLQALAPLLARCAPADADAAVLAPELACRRQLCACPLPDVAGGGDAWALALGPRSATEGGGLPALAAASLVLVARPGAGRAAAGGLLEVLVCWSPPAVLAAVATSVGAPSLLFAGCSDGQVLIWDLGEAAGTTAPRLAAGGAALRSPSFSTHALRGAAAAKGGAPIAALRAWVLPAGGRSDGGGGGRLAPGAGLRSLLLDDGGGVPQHGAAAGAVPQVELATVDALGRVERWLVLRAGARSSGEDWDCSHNSILRLVRCGGLAAAAPLPAIVSACPPIVTAADVGGADAVTRASLATSDGRLWLLLAGADGWRELLPHGTCSGDISDGGGDDEAVAAATAAAAAEPLPRAAAVTSLAAHPQQPGVLLVGRADGSVAVTGADGELLREWPAPWAATEAAEPRAVATVAWLPARGASAAVAVDEGGRVAVWTAIAGRCAAPAVLRIGGDVGDAALLATAVAAGGRALLWLTVGGATGCLPI